MYSCHKCQKTFKFNSKLIIHLDRIIPCDRIIECEICKERFVTLHLLKQHMGRKNVCLPPNITKENNNLKNEIIQIKIEYKRINEENKVLKLDNNKIKELKEQVKQLKEDDNNKIKELKDKIKELKVNKKEELKQLKEEKVGKVYIFSTDNYEKDNIKKIGRTSGEISGRLSGYNCGRIPQDKMKCLDYIETDYPIELEQRVFKYLENNGVEKISSEMYKVDFDKLKKIIRILNSNLSNEKKLFEINL